MIANLWLPAMKGPLYRLYSLSIYPSAHEFQIPLYIVRKDEKIQKKLLFASSVLENN